MYAHYAWTHTCMHARACIHTHTHTADLGDYESVDADIEYMSDEWLVSNEVMQY